MTFPGYGAEVYRNEAGEVTGWDGPTDSSFFYCEECGGHHAGACEDNYDEEEAMDDPDEVVTDHFGHPITQLDADEEDYPEGMGHRQDTWPDIDQECEEHITAAFRTLNRAPGQRDVYARVQAKLAEAIRLLRG